MCCMADKFAGAPDDMEYEGNLGTIMTNPDQNKSIDPSIHLPLTLRPKQIGAKDDG